MLIYHVYKLDIAAGSNCPHFIEQLSVYPPSIATATYIYLQNTQVRQDAFFMIRCLTVTYGLSRLNTILG